MSNEPACRFTCPQPPSTNALYANVAGKGRVRTKAYKAWIERAGWEVKIQRAVPVAGRVRMLIEGVTRIDLDNINRKNMQSNIGDIYQSNLCVEIVQHTSEKELASCNLASVCYPTHIKSTAKGNKVDWLSLAHTVRVMIKALNQIIDRNYYPEELPKIKHTNLKNRPIALGEQGLADLFAMLDLSWEEPKTRKLYYRLQETQYYWALMESCELAAMDGPYPAFAGSPYSRGTLHTDLCDAEGKAPDHPEWSRIDSSLWSRLRQRIVRVGVRNSLLRAKMPTATTAYMIGNNESFEPFTHLIYTRRLLSGKFTHVNKYLYDDIMKK